MRLLPQRPVRVCDATVANHWRECVVRDRVPNSALDDGRLVAQLRPCQDYAWRADWPEVEVENSIEFVSSCELGVVSLRMTVGRQYPGYITDCFEMAQ